MTDWKQQDDSIIGPASVEVFPDMNAPDAPSGQIHSSGASGMTSSLSADAAAADDSGITGVMSVLDATKLWQGIIGTTTDGQFGPATAAATKTWQSKNGITPDGVVGPLTWTQAGYANPMPTLSQNVFPGAASPVSPMPSFFRTTPSSNTAVKPAATAPSLASMFSTPTSKFVGLGIGVGLLWMLLKPKH